MKDGYDLPPEAPGQYMPLPTNEPFAKRYIPARLPPTLDLSREVIDECNRAMWALGRLEGLGTEIDNPGAVFSSFVYKEAEQSSRVEGTAVTVSDLYRYEIENASIEATENDHEADVREARNYISALDDAVGYLRRAGFDRENITIELIQSLHEQLLEEGRAEDDNPLPGEFRPDYAYIEEEGPHGISSQIRFVPPTESEVPGLMNDLQNFVQRGGGWPTLIDIAITHYQFETIHPFKDGNGRVGRLLVVLMLLADELLHFPLLYLSSYIERHRSEYTDRLLAVSEAGEWDEWLLFFLRGIREQAEEAFIRAKLLINLRKEYGEAYKQSTRRLALALFEEPYFTVTEASEQLDVAYRTANDATARLEDDGVVREITGNKQNRVFRGEEIMETVERPAQGLPDPSDLLDVEQAWRLPER